ncbi:hypothetical protein CMV_016480 [Castanea mollissima]|uniref:Uncharacterized protein n=1 Tax=Castanea mollissima TaxID=60419 RepID=A0A8J4VI40_9ROSI|nr:hypothetical protein CMV_016480 [Castanea mollissima]
MTVIFEVLGKEDYKSPANNDPLRINWTREMDHYIMVLMSEQLHRGKKALKQLPREKFKIATKFGIQKLEFLHYNRTLALSMYTHAVGLA